MKTFEPGDSACYLQLFLNYLMKNTMSFRYRRVFWTLGALVGLVLIYESLIRSLGGPWGMLPLGLLCGSIVTYVCLCCCGSEDAESESPDEDSMG